MSFRLSFSSSFFATCFPFPAAVPKYPYHQLDPLWDKLPNTNHSVQSCIAADHPHRLLQQYSSLQRVCKTHREYVAQHTNPVVRTKSTSTSSLCQVRYLSRNRFAIILAKVSGDLTTDMNELSTIRDKSRGSNAHVSVYSLYSSICAWKQEFRSH